MTNKRKTLELKYSLQLGITATKEQVRAARLRAYRESNNE